MISKIDCLGIIRKHFETLRKYGSSETSIADLVLFYAIPTIVSCTIVLFFKRYLSKGAIDFLATVFSVFIGLLLNLLVLIFDVVRKDELGEETRSKIRQEVLEQTFANISYSIFISLILLTILFASKLADGKILQLLSFIAFAIVGNFVLTLFMVLKRVHTLLAGEARGR